MAKLVLRRAPNPNTATAGRRNSKAAGVALLNWTYNRLIAHRAINRDLWYYLFCQKEMICVFTGKTIICSFSVSYM